MVREILPSTPVVEVDSIAFWILFIVISKPFLLAKRAFKILIFSSFFVIVTETDIDPVKGYWIFSILVEVISGWSPCALIFACTMVISFCTVTKICVSFVLIDLIQTWSNLNWNTNQTLLIEYELCWMILVSFLWWHSWCSWTTDRWSWTEWRWK